MSKAQSRFSQGLGKLEAIGGKAPRPTVVPANASIADAVADEGGAGGKASGRAGKVNIAGYFDPAVRKQLAMLAIEHDTDQVKLMAEALNLLFEKYGRSPIARA